MPIALCPKNTTRILGSIAGHAHGSHTLSSWVSSGTMLVLIPAVCLAVCVLVLLALRLPGSSLKVGLA